jgi:hypothetical protein
MEIEASMEASIIQTNNKIFRKENICAMLKTAIILLKQKKWKTKKQP